MTYKASLLRCITKVFACNCDTNKRCNSGELVKHCNFGILISSIRDCLEAAYDVKRSQEQKIKELISEKAWKEKKLESLLFEQLKEFYCSQSKIETFVEGRILSIEDISMRLAIIIGSKEKKVKEEQDGTQQSAKDDRYPNYETMYCHKEPIKIEGLFQHTKLKQKKEKRIIVWGAAGAGKTTCLHHIAYEWANGRLWTEFKAVFWICLRNLNTDCYPHVSGDEEDYDVYYLIAKECRLLSEEYNLDLVTFRSLLTNKEFINNTLLFLDGYDELPDIADRGYLASAFRQLQEIFPHVLISSRPQSVTFIQDSVEVEILGFDRKNINQYVRNFYDQISKSSELSSEKLQNRLKDLHDVLKHNPLIYSLSCIPINLELLCCLYFFGEGVDAKALMNITSFYYHIINWLCKRFLRSVKSEVSSANIHEVDIYDHSKISPLISMLKEVAWDSMDKNTLYFPQNKIRADFFDDIISFGLLEVQNQMANFINSSFQEYFAAMYLANYYIQGQSNKIKKEVVRNKLVPRYGLVFEMIAGYLSILDKEEALQKFFDDLLSEPYDLAVNYELNLLSRCFKECKNPSIIKQYPRFIEFAAGYIQNNWLISKHSIAQLLAYNHDLLSQEKIYSVILKVLSQCEIILYKEDSKKLSTLALDIANTSFLKNTETKVQNVRRDINSFLVEIAQVNHKLAKHVINIFTNIINTVVSENYIVERYTATDLKEICQSEMASEKTVITIVNVLTETLSNSEVLARRNTAKALLEICRLDKASEEIISSVTKTLINALNDADKIVRISTFDSLCDISQLEKVSEEIVMIIIKVVKEALSNLSEIERIRMDATEVLDEIYRSEKVSKEIEKDIEKTLITALSDANNWVRVCAFTALGNVCKSGKVFEETLMKTIKAIKESLGDTDVFVQQHASEALGDICKSEKAYEETLNDVAKTLTNDLSNENEYVRMGVAKALGEMCRSAKVSEEIVIDVVKALSQSLSDANEDARYYAAHSLYDIFQSDHVSEETITEIAKTLTEALSDKNGYGINNIVEVLGKICESEKASEETITNVVNALTDALSDACRNVRNNIAKILVNICRSDKVSEEIVATVAKALIEALGNKNGYDRSDIAEALGGICLSKKISEEIVIAIVKTLNEALGDTGEYVRSCAVRALGEICQSEKVSEKTLLAIVKALGETLVDADKYIIMGAAKALGEICRSKKVSEDIVKAIIKALKDALKGTDEHVRLAFLGWVGQSEKIPEEIVIVILKAINASLKDADKYVRQDAAKALLPICKSKNSSESEVMFILKILKEALSDPYVRRYASDALCSICRSENDSEEIKTALTKSLVDALSKPGKYVRICVSDALSRIKQADKVFAELVSKNINVGNLLVEKKYIDYILKNVNILASMDTCKYAIRLCNNTSLPFSCSKDKIYVAGREHYFENSKLTFDALVEANIFGMVKWRE